MRHLIIPGLAKAGTTFLHDYFLNHGENIFNIPIRKETRFYSRNSCISDINSYYISGKSDKIYLDATPSYLSSPNSSAIVKNLCGALAGEDTYFVICLRNYFDRIVSHYLHDLKGAYKESGRQRWNRGNYTLYSKFAIKKYFSTYAEECQCLVDTFGRERILALSTKDTYSDTSIKKINAMVGVDIPIGDFTKVSNPGGWVPNLVYGGNEGVEVYDGNNIVFIPPKALLSINNNRSWIRYNVDYYEGLEAVNNSATWSSRFNNNGKYFLRAKEDYMRACDVLQIEPELPTEDFFIASRPMISEKLVKKLLVS
ncbi:hypothetical protein [Cobetia sp. UCD-24C]|uniref:hypothetical protein n=1 Tax=Cobetia sp. UCD-24C TaxID=1716176 RepID=UPI00128F1ED4|nr:hypothetical protein [Cobetia sp. UCD-24C]